MNTGFFLLFLLDDTGIRIRAVPLANESGSGSPKNIWILLRIRNTEINCTQDRIVGHTEPKFKDDSIMSNISCPAYLHG
jgi:hypothetical protein